MEVGMEKINGKLDGNLPKPHLLILSYFAIEFSYCLLCSLAVVLRRVVILS